MTRTTSLTSYDPGDVTIVPFKFTRAKGTKNRPAVILSIPEYHDSRSDAVMVALTTKLDRDYFGDCIIEDWRGANLPQPCLAKGVIQTIPRAAVKNRLGSLTAGDLQRVRDSIKLILGLS